EPEAHARVGGTGRKLQRGMRAFRIVVARFRDTPRPAAPTGADKERGRRGDREKYGWRSRRGFLLVSPFPCLLLCSQIRIGVVPTIRGIRRQRSGYDRRPDSRSIGSSSSTKSLTSLNSRYTDANRTNAT